MSVELFIRRYAEGDAEPIIELFRSYFQVGDKLLTSTYTEWLYGQNPCGPAYVVVATDDDRWVGFLAMVPVRLVRLGLERQAYYVVNVLVHPAYQGQHLFSRMITYAKQQAKDEGAFLMGHPNQMALKMWQRARMQFQSPLRPVLVLPSFRRQGVKARTIERSADLGALLAGLTQARQHLSNWQLVLSPAYVRWRFFDHPNYRYRVQVLFRKDQPIGLQVARRIRPLAHLLIDQFVLPSDASAATSALPTFTVALRASGRADASQQRMVRLPGDKEIPFFITDQTADGSTAVGFDLGLACSDF